MPGCLTTLTVVLKRLLADRDQAEGGQAPLAVASPSEGSLQGEPDPGMRRLGWMVAVVVVLIVVGVAVALSRLPGLWESDRPASRAAPAATWVGEFPSAGNTGSGPAGSAPAAAGGSRSSGAPQPGSTIAGVPTAGASGGAVAPALDATATPPATMGPGATTGTTAPVTGETGATAQPGPTTAIPPDLKSALADLSAEINFQVDAGQLAPIAGSDLQGKVNQVAREASEGDWDAAHYYADRIREKLRKYRADGMVTYSGYQALIAKLDVVDAALQ